MMKKLLSTVVLLLCVTFAFAQGTFKVKGNIKNETGEGAIGAYIVVKGTTIGTSADLDGNFEIVAAQGDVLEISLIGYKNQEITVSGDQINTILEVDSELLEEVVVIGYGTQKKQDVSGSVASINIKKIENISVSDASS